ncbi:hypothetical protein QBC47DRAFT_388267 [Echria macrotheca]|uniref:Amine oxidase domain-containing protein n=1 Tax=Echria macrotheca TaxID=438768 RepID=A0AAJ0B7V6_9PEZI|nr:hypothetical protein QBC47DRAFT_388267 [Echria macrotheca]
MYSIRAHCIARARLGVLAGRLPTSVVSVRKLSSDSSSSSATPNLSSTKPPNIAVLGGGLTGLTTAFWLSRFLPKDAHITLYEASDRLGGWIDTAKVEVEDARGRRGTVNFDSGARMVMFPKVKDRRSDHLFFWELINELRLGSELLYVPSSRPAPLAQYVYYPDHLVKLPARNGRGLANLWRFFREPLARGALTTGISLYLRRLLFKPRAVPRGVRLPEDLYTFPAIRRPVEETSIGDFYVRNGFSRDLVNRVVSPMIHGIWGGDVWKLSDMRHIISRVMKTPGPGSRSKLWEVVSDEDLDGALTVSPELAYSGILQQLSLKYRYGGFKKGFGTLTDALAAALEASPNVTIKKGTPIASVRLNEGKALEIRTRGSDVPVVYDKAISTIFSKTLASLTGDKLPSLADTSAVTIMVVNLWYPTPGLHHPHDGLGYLIPQSVGVDQNPERALGVLFDSDREDASVIEDHKHGTVEKWTDVKPEPMGTKLFVLLGGHYWDGVPADKLPSADEAIVMAKSLVARHLGIPAHENERAVASAKLCRDCIPQHTVGHWTRMQRAKGELLEAFGGKLAVAGPSYQAPGVNGSVRAGRDIAAYVAGVWPLDKPNKFLSPVGDTGLDRFEGDSKFYFVSKQDVPWKYSAAPNQGYIGRLWAKGRENL